MKATSEKQCIGCGATVTLGMGVYPIGGETWRDSSCAAYCAHSLASASPLLHSVSLPPVAINPDHGSALDANNVCPTCFREYGDDEIKFCTADDCPSHPDYRVAIKPEAALTPLEKEMLAALKELITASDFNPHRPMNPKQISLLANAQGKAQDAIAKATAAQSQAKPEVAPQVWFRETKTLNFLYIARPDGRFWVVAMETERGDIYAIENSPARNPSAKPMAVQA